MNKEKPAFLPLFPLEMVVFPGEKVKLHIFEPRYLQLIHECESSGITFGIPAYIDGDLAEYGTEMALLTIFSVDENGEMDILTEGRRVFRLVEFVRHVPGRLYSGGQVVFIENDPDDSQVSKAELMGAFVRFHTLLHTGYRRDNFRVGNLSFQLAQEVGLTMKQKVRLLSMTRESERLRTLTEHLKNVIPIIQAAEETKLRIRKNGRFLRFPPIDL